MKYLISDSRKVSQNEVSPQEYRDDCIIEKKGMVLRSCRIKLEVKDL